MTALTEVFVPVRPDTRDFGPDLTRRLRKIDASKPGAAAGRSFGTGFSSSLKGVLAGASALFVVDKVRDFFTSTIAEAREAQKVGALTAQVIKTTGGVANVSAGQVESLATALSNKAGVDDELIQSGANLLLTFKNVRNEAGRGAKIFDRATAAALDLSAAGFGDMTSTSKILGKALNDPIRGLTALGRAGVTFTQQQKDQIKAMVESGDVLSAQKIILGEVESQVGGAAAASATAGEKISVTWNNLKESAGKLLLPVLDKLFGVLGTGISWLTTTGVPGFMKFAKAVGEKVGPVLSEIGEFIRNDVVPALKEFGGWIAGSVVPAVQDLATWIGQNLLPTIMDFGVWVRDNILPVLKDLALWIGDKVSVVFKTWTTFIAENIGWLKPMAGIILGIVAAVKVWTAAQWLLNAALAANPIGLIAVALGALVTALMYAWQNSETFRNIVTGVWTAVRDAVVGAWNWMRDNVFVPFREILKAVWERAVEMKDIVVAAWDAISAKVSAAWEGMKAVVQTGVRTIVDIFLGFVEMIITGADKAFGWIPGIGDDLGNAANDFVNFRDDVNASLGGVKDKKVTVSVDGRRTISSDFASGGPVFGPGTGTSDSIPANLSNGEHVFTADEVKAFGGHGEILRLRKAIRSGVASFAKGGPVGMDVVTKMSAASVAGLATDFIDSSAKLFVEQTKALLAKRFAALPKGPGGTPDVSGKFAFPLPRGSYRVGQGPAGHGYPAQDFPAPTGTPVFAPFAGQMTGRYIGNRSYGRFATVTAGALQFLVAHLSALVGSNRLVKMGEMIGRVGSVGNSSGPHAHVEFKLAGRGQDPRRFLKYDSGGYLPPGIHTVANGTGGVERVLDRQETKDYERGRRGGDFHYHAHLNTTLDEQMREMDRHVRYAQLAHQRVTEG